MPSVNYKVALAAVGLALVALVAGCARPKPPQDLSNVTIAMQRTMCFGSCPAYQVVIAGDGKVSYCGQAFVDVQGRQTANIPPGDVRRLVDAFYAADFHSLRDKYSAGVTDHPTIVVVLKVGDRTKRVVDYVSGPQRLRDLEREIDRTARTSQWIGTRAQGGQTRFTDMFDCSPAL